MRSAIPPERLREIREQGVADASRSPFVDPRAAARATDALRRRGEAWAQDVLGRTFDRRSLAYPTLPWLDRGELEALMLADTEEDDAAFAAIIGRL